MFRLFVEYNVQIR